MTRPATDRTTFAAYLVQDEELFLSMHYPEFVYERPSPGVYAPPRDAYTITIQEAANILGMSRAGAYKMAVERGEFESCRKVGPPDKPVYLLDVREVREEAKRRGPT